jgi:hypothetical protein
MSDQVLEEALNLREKGFAVHWLQPKSKVPVSSGWSESSVLSVDDLRSSYRLGYNVGFRPGIWSIVGKKALVVLDVDVRGGPAYAHEAYAAAQSLVGDVPPTVVSGSGVGRHYFLWVPKDKAPSTAAQTLRHSDLKLDGKFAWQIELLSTGKNVVLPPSIHPETGERYRWYAQESS